MTQQPARDQPLVPLRREEGRVEVADAAAVAGQARRDYRDMALGMMRALYEGDYVPRSQQPAPQAPQADVAAVAAAAAGAAVAAANASNRPYQQQQTLLAVSDMATGCKMCPEKFVVSLTNFNPDKAKIKYCNRRCPNPTVAHYHCIEKYMEDNCRGEFRLECPTPGCGSHIEHTRVSVVKPSEIPVSIWRLFIWLVSNFIFWPAVYYPIVVMFSWTRDLIDWYENPGGPYEFPDTPFWNYYPSIGKWILLGVEEKWLAGIFAVWFVWTLKVAARVFFSIWPFSKLPGLFTRLKNARYRYR